MLLSCAFFHATVPYKRKWWTLSTKACDDGVLHWLKAHRWPLRTGRRSCCRPSSAGCARKPVGAGTDPRVPRSQQYLKTAERKNTISLPREKGFKYRSPHSALITKVLSNSLIWLVRIHLSPDNTRTANTRMVYANTLRFYSNRFTGTSPQTSTYGNPRLITSGF